MWNQVHTQWLCSYPVPNVTIVSLSWDVYGTWHQGYHYQWGKRNWKNANIMSVSWRLPLVSEFPRKEKKKSGIEKSKPRKSAEEAHVWISLWHAQFAGSQLLTIFFLSSFCSTSNQFTSLFCLIFLLKFSKFISPLTSPEMLSLGCLFQLNFFAFFYMIWKGTVNLLTLVPTSFVSFPQGFRSFRLGQKYLLCCLIELCWTRKDVWQFL